jgi:hypothetical protein
MFNTNRRRTMSPKATTAISGRRDRMKKVMSAVDRVSLGLMYALFIAVLPISAVGFVTHTI